MIKKFYMALLVSLSFFIFTTTVFAANITNIRWGSQDNGNLRVVIDCDSATLANVYTQGQNAVLKVDSEVASNVATDYEVKNPLAKKLTLKKEGSQTLIFIPLEVATEQIDYKVFALKENTATNKPNRIVLDLFKKAGSSTALIKNDTATAKATEELATTTIKLENVAAKAVPKAKVPIVLKSGSKTIKLEKVSESTKVLTDNTAVYKPLTKDISTETTVAKPVQNVLPVKTTKPNIKVLSKTSSNDSFSVAVTPTSSVKPLSKESIATPKTEPAKTFKTVTLTKAQERAAEWEKLKSKSVSSKENKEEKLTTIKLDKAKSDTNSHKFRDLVAAASASSKSLKGKVIVLDPGHGGNDPGAIGLNGTKEKDLTLSIAVKVYHDLVDKGATVYLTRWTDTEVATPDATDSEELQARVNIAKWKNADVFISLHINASTNRNIGGISTYYYPKTSEDIILARAIQDKVTANIGLNDLGVRETNFYVNKRSTMTSCLVEMGFISNAKEEQLLNSNWFKGKIANLISQGIENYLD